MLGSQIVMIETTRLLDGAFDPGLPLCGDSNHPLDNGMIMFFWVKGFDLLANLVLLHLELSQGLGRNPLVLAHECQQQMLGANASVIISARFFACQRQYTACLVGKLISKRVT